MGNTELGGILRALVATGVGYLVGKGYITNEVAAQLTVGLTALGVSLWSIAAKRLSK